MICSINPDITNNYSSTGNTSTSSIDTTMCSTNGTTPSMSTSGANPSSNTTGAAPAPAPTVQLHLPLQLRCRCSPQHPEGALFL